MEKVIQVGQNKFRIDLGNKKLVRLNLTFCDVTVMYGPYEDFIRFHARIECRGGRMHSKLIAARYIEIETSGKDFASLDLRIEDGMRPETSYGTFRCSDETLNRIFDVSKQTVHVCIVPNSECNSSYDFLPQENKDIADTWHGKTTDDVLTDGGRRDREVWSGDLLPEIRTAWVMFREGEVIENSLDLLLQAIDERGFIPASGISRQCLYEYDCWFLIVLHEYMMLSGNRSYFLENREKILRVVTFIESLLGEQGYLNLDVRQTWAWTLSRKGPLTSSNCVCARAFECAARLFADETDFENNAGANRDEAGKNLSEHFTQVAERIKDHLRRRSYDPSNEAFLDEMDLKECRYSLDANALAVLFGVTQGGQTKAVLESMNRLFGVEYGMLVMNPKEVPNGQNWVHNDHIWPFCVGFAVEALFQSGETEEALRLIRKTWGRMLECGAQTFWEIMDGETGEFMKRRIIEADERLDTWNSASHGWSAGLPLLLYNYVAGIVPVDYGYRRAEFAPDFADLSFLEAEIPAYSGSIRIRFDRTPEGIRLEFGIPEDVELLNRSIFSELPERIVSGVYQIGAAAEGEIA